MLESVRIERYEGPRAEVRWLFEIAEVSAENLDGYIDDGELLVAVCNERRVGYPDPIMVDGVRLWDRV